MLPPHTLVLLAIYLFSLNPLLRHIPTAGTSSLFLWCLTLVISKKVTQALDRVLWSLTTWKKSPRHGFQSLQTPLSFVRPFATSLQVRFLAHFFLSALNLKVNLTLTWALQRHKEHGWDQNSLMEKLPCCPIILLWQPTFHSRSIFILLNDEFKPHQSSIHMSMLLHAVSMQRKLLQPYSLCPPPFPLASHFQLQSWDLSVPHPQNFL